MSSELSRRRALAALAATPLAVAAACSRRRNATPPPPGTAGTTATSTAAPAPVPVAPLTGAPAPDPSVLSRPALVVKIDNASAAARPQAGPAQADLVFEEKVEGPVSRFAAVFHSQDADPVGPVRSGRTTDIAIVGSLDTPLYAFSGANSTFLPKLRAAPLVDVGADTAPDLYDRRPGRTAPDNLFTTTQRLWSRAPEGARPPGPQFTYRPAGTPATDGQQVRVLRFSFGGGRGAVTGSFTWDEAVQAFSREQNGTPHVDEGGVVFAPVNVVAQFVDYVDTGVRDVAGTPVPEAQLVGEGDAWVLRDGRLVRGRWSRAAATETTTWTTLDGGTVAFAPGQTWILLLPVGSGAEADLADGTTIRP